MLSRWPTWLTRKEPSTRRRWIAVAGVVVHDRVGLESVRAGEAPWLVVVDEHDAVGGQVEVGDDPVELTREHRLEGAILGVSDPAGVLDGRVGARRLGEGGRRERRRHRVRVRVRVHQYRHRPTVRHRGDEPVAVRPREPAEEGEQRGQPERGREHDGRRQQRLLEQLVQQPTGEGGHLVGRAGLHRPPFAPDGICFFGAGL